MRGANPIEILVLMAAAGPVITRAVFLMAIEPKLGYGRYNHYKGAPPQP